MENGNDLSHVIKLIEKYTADAKSARQQAAAQRLRAQHGDPGTAYLYQEAARDDHHADELENHIDQLRSAEKNFRQRLAELDNQLANTDPTHTDRINQIKNERVEVLGSGMML